jgi:hypothetical protein
MALCGSFGNMLPLALSLATDVPAAKGFHQGHAGNVPGD